MEVLYVILSLLLNVMSVPLQDIKLLIIGLDYIRSVDEMAHFIIATL